jgi:hypothetical protein
MDSLLLFGSPKSNDQGELDAEGLKNWAFDSLSGAPVGVVTNFMSMITAMGEGDLGRTPPTCRRCPSRGRHRQGAARLVGTEEEGLGGGHPGTQLTTGEAVWKALGFQPASVAERFELGGSGYEHNQQKSAGRDRLGLVQGWMNADKGAPRAAQWQAIQEWNKTHKGKERITMDGLQKALAKRKTTARNDARQAAQ